MLFWRDKKSCWEFMECERGPGGSKAETLGLCPVALKKNSPQTPDNATGNWHGNDGMSGNKATVGIGKKHLECLHCDYFLSILHEAGTSMELRKPGPDNTNAIIRNRMPILAILSQCYQSNARFDTSFDEDATHFQSRLTDIDPETNVLTFLTREMAPGELCRSNKLYLSSQLHGSDVRFTTTLFGAGETDGDAYFMVKLPHFIYHPRLRQSYRVNVDGTPQQFQGYSDNSKQPIKGRIVDLSVDGIGIIVQQKTSLIQGEILKDCSFVLPNGHGVPAAIEVRDIHYNSKLGTTRLGGQFHEVPKPYEQHLVRFIYDAQRNEARRLN